MALLHAHKRISEERNTSNIPWNKSGSDKLGVQSDRVAGIPEFS